MASAVPIGLPEQFGRDASLRNDASVHSDAMSEQASSPPDSGRELQSESSYSAAMSLLGMEEDGPSTSGKAFKQTKTLNIDKIAGGKGGTVVNQYVIIKTLGTGSYGKVKLCLNTEDQKLYAVKIFNKRMLKRRSVLSQRKNGGGEEPIDHVQHEIAIMKKLLHPNVVNLYEVIDNPDGSDIYMIIEYVDGGAAMPSAEGESEDNVRHIIREVCKGLEYLHYNKVIHRDLKPANLLRCTDGTVKIADFGVSKLFTQSDTLTNTAGTPAFLAPEMCCPGPYHGKATDIWALGVCLFNLIFGEVPFKGQTIVQVYESIKKNEVEFPSGFDVTDQLKDLVLRMLEKDPTSRLTLPEVMHHPWITNGGKEPIPSLIKKAPVRVRASSIESSNAIKRNHVVSLLSPLLSERIYQPGEFLMRKGEIGQEMFFINDGVVDILINPDDKEVKAAESDLEDDFASDEDFGEGKLPGMEDEEDGPPGVDEARLHVIASRDAGQFIGEMALFDEDSRRTAYVRARTEVRVLVVSKDQVKEVMAMEPEARDRIKRTIAKRKSEIIVGHVKANLGEHGTTVDDIRARLSDNYEYESYERLSGPDAFPNSESFSKKLEMAAEAQAKRDAEGGPAASGDGGGNQGKSTLKSSSISEINPKLAGA